MGTLIALEGIDGSGKSTQARRLQQSLIAAGRTAVIFREPGDTEYGDKLRQQFRDGRSITPEEEAQLFIEDRRIDVEQNIQPSLDDGAVVIMDRYYFSTMAHQGALGLDVAELQRVNEDFAPRPALTLVLDLPAEVSAERIEQSRGQANTFEGVEYLRGVRDIFLSLRADDVAVVDATVSEDELAADVLERVLAVVSG